MRPRLQTRTQEQLWSAATLLSALAIFVADIYTPPDCVVGGLYVVVVLMAGQFCDARRLIAVALGCAGLTIVAQFASHRLVVEDRQTAMIGAFNAGSTSWRSACPAISSFGAARRKQRFGAPRPISPM